LHNFWYVRAFEHFTQDVTWTGHPFNFSGRSSSGNSSACLAAISLAGSPDRAGSLDLSRRGLAEMASDSNDLAFVLDDTEKGEDGPGALVRTLKSVVHMVPGGRSKLISRGVDQSRFPQLRWSAFALTSSPRPIPQLARENRWSMSPGDKVRLFEISVPGPKEGGIFDRAKGDNAQRAQRSIELIAELQGGYLNHYGHTIPLWVQYLMATDLSKRILQLVDHFVDHVKARGNGWEVRFATKFGLVYAAMQMGTDAGLLPRPQSCPQVLPQGACGGPRPHGARQWRCDACRRIVDLADVDVIFS
jgi:Domain of unknown function (DUF927)